MPKEIKAYGCEFCSMTSKFKGHVTRHEGHSCRKNPNRPNCRSCDNLEHESETPSCGCPINPQIHGNYEPYEPPYWWCSVTEENIEYEGLGKTRDCAAFKHFSTVLPYRRRD